MCKKNKLKLFACSMMFVGGVAQAKPPLVVSDVFPTKPEAATVHGKSCEVAKRYVDLTNAKQYGELHTLFAEDAVFLTPVGKVLRGSKEIGAFYSTMIESLGADLVPISFISDGADCVMELAARTKNDKAAGKGFQLSAIDHFTVNAEGKIIHMIVYVRPGRLHDTPSQGEDAKSK